ncbi:MAG: DUF2065 domain-containing protein [Chromatiaceae bacterium]|nr:DUF2065 domain-containing protein [Gammaproteobacteria bacterium]MCP5301113.1 DUF2065 domain-containing protein [Chromatiaceae bacterium]MCP5421415.1 DUF2065 domain-containing protein [Chromatiaceae bacterium]
MWQDLLTAMALMMVLEGILPFLSPGGFRNMVRMVGEMDDKTLRNGGLATMLAGLVLLYLVR